jgi:hypothetical protein
MERIQSQQDPDSLAHLLAAFLSLSAHRGQQTDAHTLVHDAIRGSQLPSGAQVNLMQQITKSFNDLVRVVSPFSCCDPLVLFGRY